MGNVRDDASLTEYWGVDAERRNEDTNVVAERQELVSAIQGYLGLFKINPLSPFVSPPIAAVMLEQSLRFLEAEG